MNQIDSDEIAAIRAITEVDEVLIRELLKRADVASLLVVWKLFTQSTERGIALQLGSTIPDAAHQAASGRQDHWTIELAKELASRSAMPPGAPGG